MTAPGSEPANRKARRRQARLARPPKQRPPHPELRRGLELFKAGALAEAASACRRALAARQRDAAALHLLGAITAAQGCYGEAVQLFAQAIEIEPNDAAALNNLGNALQGQALHQEAAACYRRALAVTPDDADIHVNLGDTYRTLKRWGEAIASYERVLQLDPEHVEALTSLIHVLAHTCTWERTAELNARADELITARLASGREAPEAPLSNIARCDDPSLNLAIARQYATDITRAFGGPEHAPEARRAALTRAPVRYRRLCARARSRLRRMFEIFLAGEPPRMFAVRA